MVAQIANEYKCNNKTIYILILVCTIKKALYLYFEIFVPILRSMHILEYYRSNIQINKWKNDDTKLSAICGQFS